MKNLSITLTTLLFFVATSFAQTQEQMQTKEMVKTQTKATVQIQSKNQTGTSENAQKNNEAVREQVQNVKAAAKDDIPNKGQVSGEAKKLNEAVKLQVANKNQPGSRFIDEDGDGVCDNNATQNKGTMKSQKRMKAGKGSGPGDGTRNKGVGPKDGTGYGASSRTKSGGKK